MDWVTALRVAILLRSLAQRVGFPGVGKGDSDLSAIALGCPESDDRHGRGCRCSNCEERFILGLEDDD